MRSKGVIGSLVFLFALTVVIAFFFYAGGGDPVQGAILVWHKWWSAATYVAAKIFPFVF